ncbi:hypothetical protein ACQ4PT_041499 [Festuca glaucescens]
MATPSWKWSVSYVKTQDLVTRSEDPMMGELHLWTAKDWIGLMTTKGTPIVGKYLKRGDLVDVGSVVEFLGFTAKVIHCVLSPTNVCPASDHELLKMSGSDPNSRDRGWHVTYSTHRDLCRGRMKSYDGSLLLSVKDNWLLLKDAKGAMVGRHGVKSTDSFSIGAKLSFPNHAVRLGSQWKFAKPVISPSVNMVKVVLPDTTVVNPTPAVTEIVQEPMMNSSTSASVADHVVIPTPAMADSLIGEGSFANSVHASLFMGLNFSHGNNFAKDVRYKFNVDVHPSSKDGHFLMVVSFGRANFRMEEDLVSIALESVIGGYCGELKVALIKDRVFSFCFSSKEVGFHILKLRRFACAQFKCFFHLWGRGGPNWRWEYRNWCLQCEADWTLVSPTRRTVQKGLAALQKKASQSSMAKSHSVKKQLKFAAAISYEACLGYSNPNMNTHQDNTVTTPPIPLVPENVVSDGSVEADQMELSRQTNLNERVSVGPVEHAKEDEAFHEMIDDMAYKVWACRRCLNMGHATINCVNDIRCMACFNYGHIRKNCLISRRKSSQTWIPKRSTQSIPVKETEESAAPSSSYLLENLLESRQNPLCINPKQPPDPAASPSSPETMAVFEVDPLPWLPWGHQVIDGGPTRLPRTYYYAAQDPPALHQAFCIATVEPPPPPQAAALWRDQVHNFLVGPLQRNVVSSQPSLFGVGMFEMSSPNSASALVQHGQFQLQNCILRFLHVGEAPQNHRAALGFRRGWLMFLGMHPDYSNDLDIANAVATFGQYHTRNNNDPVLERVLVYASFPSPQLVPRDVVFGKFSLVGGVKESWIAPVYILTADFADILPADEDQMPPDGNPHPLPSELLQNHNLFVNPQFPEVGWDAVQQEHDLGQHDGGNVAGNNGNWQDVMEEEGQEAPVSMILNLSDSSSSSVNMMGMNGANQQLPGMAHNVLHVGLVTLFIGPPPPPEIQRRRFLSTIVPSLPMQLVQNNVQYSPFNGLLKVSVDIWGKSFASGICAVDGFSSNGASDVISLLQDNVGCTNVLSALEGSNSATTPRNKRKKCAVPMVPRAKMLVGVDKAEKVGEKQQKRPMQEDQGVQEEIHVTPVHVLQRVGRELGIAPERLTKDQLEADPVVKKKTGANEDKI